LVQCEFAVCQTCTINEHDDDDELRADHMVRTTILHVTSAKWLVNYFAAI